MALIQVSSTQKQFSKETQGRNYFGINQGYSFSNSFDGSPLEIPPYAQLAMASGTFTMNKEDIVVNAIGGDSGTGVTGFKLTICSEIPSAQDSTGMLNVFNQVTAPMSQTESSNKDWRNKYTTKCPQWFYAPQGVYGSQSAYFKQIINILNVTSNPQFHGEFKLREVLDASFGLSVQIEATPVPAYTNKDQGIQQSLYSGFVNLRTAATMELKDVVSGSGATQFYGSMEKTAGQTGQFASKHPAVAQTNCTGVKIGNGSIVQTGGILAPAGDYSTVFRNQSSHRSMFGISRAGGIEPGFDSFFKAAATVADPDTYISIYLHYENDLSTVGNYEWALFMHRCCMDGNVNIQQEEIFEYAYLCLPAIADKPINKSDKFESDWTWVPTGPALDPNGEFGFKYYILKLQFDSHFGYFYFPIMTGDTTVGVGVPGGDSDQTYNIPYASKLDPKSYTSNAKKFGIAWAGNLTDTSYISLGFGIEGNNINFLVDGSNVEYTDQDGKSASLDSELSDITFPLQVKGSICYRGSKWTTLRAQWQTNKDGANTANMRALAYYGETQGAFFEYVNNQDMIPAWIFNRQYWQAEPASTGGFLGCRTPNLCFASNDPYLFDDFHLLFPNEQQTAVTQPFAGNLLNNNFFLQLAPSSKFDSDSLIQNKPNILSQIGIQIPAIINRVDGNTMQSVPLSETDYNNLKALGQIVSKELPFASGVYIRLKNLPCRSVFGSINQTNDKLVAVVNRFDKYYERDDSDDALLRVYSWEAYEKMYISLNNPAPMVVSNLEFELVNRFGEYQKQVDKTVLVLHLQKDKEGGLYDYDRRSISLNPTEGYTV